MDRRREIAILEFVEQGLTRELASLNYQHALANLSRSDSTNYTACLETASALYEKQGRLLLPWLEWDHTRGHKISTREVKALTDRWEKMFGSLDSPDVQEKLNKLSQMNAATVPDESESLLKHIRRL